MSLLSKNTYFDINLCLSEWPDISMQLNLAKCFLCTGNNSHDYQQSTRTLSAVAASMLSLPTETKYIHRTKVAYHTIKILQTKLLPMLERDSMEAAMFRQSSAVGISSFSVWKSLHFSVKIPLEPVNRFSTMSTLLCSSWQRSSQYHCSINLLDTK